MPALRSYTLVLTKTTDLFDREAKQRRSDESDVRWLRAQLLRSRPAGSAEVGDQVVEE